MNSCAFISWTHAVIEDGAGRRMAAGMQSPCRSRTTTRLRVGTRRGAHSSDRWGIAARRAGEGHGTVGSTFIAVRRCGQRCPWQSFLLNSQSLMLFSWRQPRDYDASARSYCRLLGHLFEPTDSFRSFNSIGAIVYTSEALGSSHSAVILDLRSPRQPAPGLRRRVTV